MSAKEIFLIVCIVFLSSVDADRGSKKKDDLDGMDYGFSYEVHESQKALAEKAKKDKERAEQAQKEKLRLEAEKAKKEKERAEADKAAKERLKLQAEKVANERAHRAFNGMRGGEALPNQVQSLGDVLNPPAAKKATTGRR